MLFIFNLRKQGEVGVTLQERFEYDSQNRLKKHYHQVDSNPQELLAENTYNDLSQLVNKKVGNNLQSIDYTYNIRGWMTKINDPANLNGKLFGYKVKYSEVEGLETPNTDFSTLKVKPKYNGNIAEVDWRTGTTTGDNLRRYGYVYDGANRLLAGFYQKDTNPSAKEYFEKMEYDLNGNISNLKRSAQSQQGAPAFNIDDLGYIYTGNRLTSVTDSSTDYRGYPDTSGNTISYDLNGNMKDHKDKGILQIDYNFLNLPKYIKFSDFASYDRSNKVYVNTNYLYRADGVKMRKVHNYKDPSYAYALGTRTTDYLDGFQYEYDWTPLSGIPTNDFQLKFVPTSEGYFDFVKNKYIYNYTDHLGNIRLSYFNSGSGAEVLEENNYYPFGMKHEGYNTSFSFGSSYQYKYNGKELQTESGMYDYGARFYMADIGRWGVQDDHQELYHSYSSYHYVADNPVLVIDPDGRDWYYTNDGQYLYNKDLNRDNASQFFKDNNIEGAKYAFASNTMGNFHYGADGVIYDDSKAGRGKAIENGTLHDIPEITLTKNLTLEKIVKSVIVGINMYSGVDELIGGVGSLLVPEPTMITKVSGVYLIGDGLTRSISGPIQLYGIWGNDKQLENVPGNLLGLVGNGIDNLNSNKPGYVTGGDGQLVGEMVGDFGLARRSLYKALMSPQGVSKMKDYIRFGNIINSLSSPARTGYSKGKKIKENEK